MKKYLYTIMACFLVLMLVGCSSGTGTQNSESSSSQVESSNATDSGEDLSSSESSATEDIASKGSSALEISNSLFLDKLQEYKEEITALSNGEKSDSTVLDEDVAEQVSNGELSTEEVGYLIEDINGDGNEDLIIGTITNNSILEIYSEQGSDTSMSLMVRSTDGTIINLCEDAIIRYNGFLSNSPGSSGVVSYYEYEKFGTETGINHGELIQEISETGDGLFYTSDTEGKPKQQEISEEEYNSTIDSYPVIELNLIPLTEVPDK